MSSPGVDQEAFQQFEHDGWEQKATGYHRYFTEVSRHNIEPLLDAAGVRPGSRVLDIGCGPGMLAAAAAARAASVIGFGMAEEMVKLARHLHPRLQFEQGLRQGTAGPGHSLGPSGVAFLRREGTPAPPVAGRPPGN